MAKTYKSRALAEAHENASDLYRLGLIDKKTMQGFDRSCLTPVKKLSPAAIRRIRAKADVSQAVFAAHLNVTVGVVSKSGGAARKARRTRSKAGLRGHLSTELKPSPNC